MSLPATPLPYGEPTPDTNENLSDAQVEKEISIPTNTPYDVQAT